MGEDGLEEDIVSPCSDSGVRSLLFALWFSSCSLGGSSGGGISEEPSKNLKRDDN